MKIRKCEKKEWDQEERKKETYIIYVIYIYLKKIYRSRWEHTRRAQTRPENTSSISLPPTFFWDPLERWLF